MLIFYIFVFVLGAIVGSFLNVVVIRLKNKEPFLSNRSYCLFCKKKLSWYELIPIISFIIQKGRCRNCDKKISWQYPLVEFFTGLIFLLIIFSFSAQGGSASGGQFSDVINLVFLLLISCFLIILFVYDLKYYLIPDKIIYPAIILTFGFRILDLFRVWNLGFRIWLDYLLAVIIGGAFFLAIFVMSHGKWMGIGDVKIGILMGLLLGISGILTALFLAFLSGAIVSIVLLILKKKTFQSEIPFGPFLTAATFVSLLWGNEILNWYLNLFM